MIRHVIDGHTQPIPAVLEIPSKDHPYDASKDSILRRAKVNTVIRFSAILFMTSKTIILYDFRGCLTQRTYDKFIYQIVYIICFYSFFVRFVTIISTFHF